VKNQVVRIFKASCIVYPLEQGWATSFARGPSSEVSQKEGPHNCTH